MAVDERTEEGIDDLGKYVSSLTLNEILPIMPYSVASKRIASSPHLQRPCV